MIETRFDYLIRNILFFNSKCPTINTIPSYTSPSSDEDVQLQEMSLNDQLSDYERNVDFTRSRQRHDTITVENEDGFNGSASGLREGTNSSFGVEFEAETFERSVANNNGKKINDDSSGVVFQHVSIVEQFH